MSQWPLGLTRERVTGPLFVVALIILPLILSWTYHWLTSLPREIIIATGPAGGRYETVAETLADVIREELGVRVRTVPTDGSRENLDLLARGEADFAIYQQGAARLLGEAPQKTGEVEFVANLYSEVVHFIVRDDLNLTTPDAWEERAFTLGLLGSGDLAVSRLFIDHLHMDTDRVARKVMSAKELETGLRDGTLDMAIITSGLHTSTLKSLLGPTDRAPCRLQSIPYLDALVQHSFGVTRYTIPAGTYNAQQPVEPQSDVSTIAMRAQLLTPRDQSSRLVEAVTEIVMSAAFQEQATLPELFAKGTEFATGRAEFPVHRGAAHYYDPNLKPLLNADFVEAMEGLRSFLFSLLIAGFFTYRWWHDHQQKRMEHRLDRYIQRALDLEQAQLEYDEFSKTDVSRELQRILNDVTTLRQQALRDFSAHDLNEDRAVDCFLEMCHALSDKINAKLTRQSLHTLTKKLSNDIDAAPSGTTETTSDLA